MTTADRYTLVFPARPEYLLLARLALTGVARLAPVDEEALADLRLAVTEAAANACRHAYDDGVGDVTVHLSLGGDDVLEVVVEDDGPGFDGDAVDEWEATPSDEDGMGLAIIRAVADDVEIGRARTAPARACASRGRCADRRFPIGVEIEHAVQAGVLEDPRRCRTGLRRSGAHRHARAGAAARRRRRRARTSRGT